MYVFWKKPGNWFNLAAILKSYLFLCIGDEKAQGVAMKALFYGYWKSLTPLQIAFLPCIVMSTAENLHYQASLAYNYA